MHQIKPHLLWVGHAGDGRNFQGIFANRIRAIVQLALEEPPIQPPRDLIFCRIPLIDGTGNDPILLNLAIDIVAAQLRSRIATLVCCGGGMSRSPAIAAAALSVVDQKPLQECLRIVAESHPHDVLPGLWAEVRCAWKKIRANRDMGLMDDFSKRFADLLFAQYPAWREFAQSDPGQTESTSLVVQVPCPNRRVVGDLLITTEEGEVTIYLDRYHNHFMQDEKQAFESALGFIADLLGERLVVIVYMAGEKWAGSMCAGPNDVWP